MDRLGAGDELLCRRYGDYPGRIRGEEITVAAVRSIAGKILG